MSENRKYGYIRVSSKDQNVDRQFDAMRAEGIAERDIIIEKASGKNFAREKYLTLKKFLRPGDTLFVTELKRFGRNKAEILDEWRDLTKSLGVDIVVMDMPILDTRQYRDSAIPGLQTLIADLVLNILAYFAEEERVNIHALQAEGIAAARRRGKHLGRPKLEEPKDFQRYYLLWKEKRITTKQAFTLMNISESSFYRLVKRKEGTGKPT